jgi:hypothetical protein
MASTAIAHNTGTTCAPLPHHQWRRPSSKQQWSPGWQARVLGRWGAARGRAVGRVPHTSKQTWWPGSNTGAWQHTAHSSVQEGCCARADLWGPSCRPAAYYARSRTCRACAGWHNGGALTTRKAGKWQHGGALTTTEAGKWQHWQEQSWATVLRQVRAAGGRVDVCLGTPTTPGGVIILYCTSPDRDDATALCKAARQQHYGASLRRS